MPQTQLSSRLGSDNSIFGLKETKKSQTSKFNFSKKNFSTLDIGSIVPVDWFNVFPGDKVKLSINYLLDTFPLEVPPMNNYFIRTHWYFIKNSALWKGWNTFITRGRSGNIDLEIPSISWSDLTQNYVDTNSNYYNFSCPNSLSDYLGIKPKFYNNDPTKASYLPYLKSNSSSVGSTTGFSGVEKYNILPLFAYQKICRYNYMPSNLLQDNKVWFPDDLEDHWYIGYNGENLSGPYFVPESSDLPDTPLANVIPSSSSGVSDNCVDVRSLRYALFGDDYFTTAKPWLVRGSEQTLDFNATSSNLSSILSDLGIDVSNSNLPTVDVTSQQQHLLGASVSNVGNINFPYISVLNGADEATLGDTTGITTTTTYSGVLKSALDSYSRSLGIDSSSVVGRNLSLSTNFSANTLRNLLSLSVWQERNTLTDGNYNRTIQVHWNHKPKSPEYAPLYIGGTTDMVSFGQVIQNSSSVSGSPLGTKAGLGSASGQSDVFNFTADDYGIIMGVMIISPEVVYSQGVGHEWTDLTFDQQFQPEFANLGYQPILNKEIFAQNSESDDDLFGYQTRYAYLKQRDNSVSGLFDLSPSQDSTFGPYVQARRFSSLPSLSNQFVTMSPSNVDRSFLSFENLPAFKLQFASNVSLIRALPYQSMPETFGF